MEIIFLAALAGPCVIHAGLLFSFARDLCDDAMISARYASNLAAGQGLRYNRAPAGADPVEGYSNFLWVMGMAEGFKRNVHPRVTAAVMGGVSSLASILILGVWVRARTGSRIAGALAAFCLGVCVYFAAWSTRGLETAMFAALAMAAVASCNPRRPGPWPYLLSFIACLARPDGLLAPAAVFIAHATSSKGDKKAIVFWAGIFFAAPFAAYTVFRLLHFHSLVPNTFYAKTGLGLPGALVGLKYSIHAAIRYWPAFATLMLGAVLAALDKKNPDKWTWTKAPFFLLVLYAGFIVYAGGDFMPDYRFIMHVLPVVIGTGFIAVMPYKASEGEEAGSEKYSPFLSRFRLPVLVLATLMTVLTGEWTPLKKLELKDLESGAWHGSQAKWYGPAASWLLLHAERSDLIACGDIGYIGFVTDVDRILDVNGLVDRYLASRPGAAGMDADLDYVLDSKPNYLVVMAHEFKDGTIIGHSAFDRAALNPEGEPVEKLARGYFLAAELDGWSVTEKSLDDGVTRTSLVRFRIYAKNGLQGRKSRI